MSIHAYLRITMYNMPCSSTRSHESHKVMSLLEKFVSVFYYDLLEAYATYGSKLANSSKMTEITADSRKQRQTRSARKKKRISDVCLHLFRTFYA